MVITVALHIALIYALIHGLARKIVEIVTPPLETKIIEEIKPPPDKPPPPPPKLAPPPPPYIPPVEVNIQMPVQTAPTITTVSPTPPPKPAPFVPTPPRVVNTPPVVNAASCDKPEYPPAARRANETGTVLLNFLIDVNGKVIDSKVERSSGSRRLDDAALEALGLCTFKPALADGKPTRAWARIEYVWRLD